MNQLNGTCSSGTVLGPVGGTVGTAITAKNCTQGFTGASVTYGTYVGKISLTCGTTTKYTVIGSGQSSGSGTTKSFTCPSGQTLSGFGGKASVYRDSIYFQCSYGM